MYLIAIDKRREKSEAVLLLVDVTKEPKFRVTSASVTLPLPCLFRLRDTFAKSCGSHAICLQGSQPALREIEHQGTTMNALLFSSSLLLASFFPLSSGEKHHIDGINHFTKFQSVRYAAAHNSDVEFEED